MRCSTRRPDAAASAAPTTTSYDDAAPGGERTATGPRRGGTLAGRSTITSGLSVAHSAAADVAASTSATGSRFHSRSSRPLSMTITPPRPDAVVAEMAVDSA